MAALAIVVGIQLAASLLVRTGKVRGYLTARLVRTFGRPVEVGRFAVLILPTPQLDVENVTIGEDPAFGNEYFLRAEHLDASLRWMGLLRGHFEFGTVSLTRPSLILVRNENGRWNLEGWLPPSGGTNSNATTTVNSSGDSGKSLAYGPYPPAETANHLQKIEFDEGRINFKVGVEKRPFVFRNVSGSVEQVSPGRWELRLQAEPWRSGVELQETGRLLVRGDVAGTTARLQPAEIRVHWDRMSLADVSRLVTGTDSGVRGELALDGEARIGTSTGEAQAAGKWNFTLEARAAQVHRWNLTERSDNPRVSAKFKGVWDVGAGIVNAEEMSVELPHSNLHGSAEMQIANVPSIKLRVASMQVSGQDLLACYRAYQPDVEEGLSIDQYFQGEAEASGWPIRWSTARISSPGGSVQVPGMGKPLRIGRVAGGMQGKKFVVEPIQVTEGAADALQSAEGGAQKLGTKSQPGRSAGNQAELSITQDFAKQEQEIRFLGELVDVTELFRVAKAFGHTLNHGWELSGTASGTMQREWREDFAKGAWSGSVRLTRAELQIAGLNQPLRSEDAVVSWKQGQRTVTLGRTEALGTILTGTIEDWGSQGGAGSPQWNFQLHADRLDATELDRWFGPRGRPNWLQRLLPSVLGGKTAEGGSVGGASELLRRVKAAGDLTVDSLTIETIKIAHAKARLEIGELRIEARDMEGQWAGGTVRGRLDGVFSPKPRYEIAGEFDRVNLAQLPWATGWGGIAAGRLRLTSEGVGREELLSALAGSAEIRLKPAEFRGWDTAASLEAAAVKTGTSRWTNGEGAFSIGNRELVLERMEVEAGRVKTEVEGSVNFGLEGEFVFEAARGKSQGREGNNGRKVLRVSGPLAKPEASVVVTGTGETRK